jgi:hypothetical protein
MSTFKSVLSSAKYHVITRPVISLAKQGVQQGIHKLKKFAQNRKAQKLGLKPRNPAIRKSILQKTRGAYASTPSAFKKTSLAGVKRRQAAAKAAKALPRPVRKYGPKTAPNKAQHTAAPRVSQGASVASPSKAPSKPVVTAPKKPTPRPKVPHGSVHAAVNSSANYGQLRRKITGLAVRKISKSFKGDRKARAAALRNYRKERGPVLKGKIRHTAAGLRAEAADILAKRKKT